MITTDATTCSTCGEQKPYSQFWKKLTNTTKHYKSCAECREKRLTAKSRKTYQACESSRRRDGLFHLCESHDGATPILCDYAAPRYATKQRQKRLPIPWGPSADCRGWCDVCLAMAWRGKSARYQFCERETA